MQIEIGLIDDFQPLRKVDIKSRTSKFLSNFKAEYIYNMLVTKLLIIQEMDDSDWEKILDGKIQLE